MSFSRDNRLCDYYHGKDVAARGIKQKKHLQNILSDQEAEVNM